jgi:hypothetical protein
VGPTKALRALSAPTILTLCLKIKVNGISNKSASYTFGIIISAIVSFYSFWSAIFFIWLNANGAWVSEAWVKSFSSLLIGIISFALFIYFIKKVVKLNKERNAKT